MKCASSHVLDHGVLFLSKMRTLLCCCHFASNFPQETFRTRACDVVLAEYTYSRVHLLKTEMNSRPLEAHKKLQPLFMCRVVRVTLWARCKILDHLPLYRGIQDSWSTVLPVNATLSSPLSSSSKWKESRDDIYSFVWDTRLKFSKSGMQNNVLFHD